MFTYHSTYSTIKQSVSPADQGPRYSLLDASPRLSAVLGPQIVKAVQFNVALQGRKEPEQSDGAHAPRGIGPRAS